VENCLAAKMLVPAIQSPHRRRGIALPNRVWFFESGNCQEQNKPPARARGTPVLASHGEEFGSQTV